MKITMLLIMPDSDDDNRDEQNQGCTTKQIQYNTSDKQLFTKVEVIEVDICQVMKQQGKHLLLSPTLR